MGTQIEKQERVASKMKRLVSRLNKISTRRVRYKRLEWEHCGLVHGLLHYGHLIDEDKAQFHMGVLARAIGRRKRIGEKYGYLEAWEVKLLKLQRKQESANATDESFERSENR